MLVFLLFSLSLLKINTLCIMKTFISSALLLILFIYSCEKDEGYRERVITSDIVGTWQTTKNVDSIIHDYTHNGKLTVKKYQDKALKYTGYFDYDITSETIMEYWGENTDNQTQFQINNKDTLWLQKFLGTSYTFHRLKNN